MTILIGYCSLKETLNVWRQELVENKSVESMEGGFTGITIEGNELGKGTRFTYQLKQVFLTLSLYR
jgi:hypothetical protein